MSPAQTEDMSVQSAPHERDFSSAEDDIDFMRFLEQLKAPKPSAQSIGTDAESISFSSVSDAKHAVETPFMCTTISTVSAQRTAIAQWVVAHKDEISFSRDDWHHLAQKYNDDDYRSCLLVAEAALEFFPFDTTLLGDALLAAGALAAWETGDAHLNTALAIDMRFIDDWWLPVRIAEYYRIKARAVDLEERQNLLQAALEHLQLAHTHLPLEDRILNEEAEVLIELNDLSGARRLLDETIFEPHINGEGISCHIMAPQCCLTYLDSLLADTDEYDRIIEVATVGLRCAATKERKVQTGYFLYRMALAKDCKIHAAASTGANAYGNKDQVLDSLRMYALAYSTNIHEAHKEVIAERFHILSVLSGITEIELEQFCEKDDSGKE